MKTSRGGNETLSDNRGYGNIAVYSPDDILMFYANNHKMRFYIKKDLVEEIGENKYRLKFKPNGLGYSETSGFGRRSTKDCLIPRENKCVVSGDEDINSLSKHHIVPQFFRKHFPVEFKSSFQTIVLLRRDIHSDYTVHEQEYYDVLAEKYESPKMASFTMTSTTRWVHRMATSLILYGHLLPKDVRERKEREFKYDTGLDPTFENLELCSQLSITGKKIKTIENDFGMALAAKITDYREFELLWLNHFIKYAKPKYLPTDLINTYDLKII